MIQVCKGFRILFLRQINLKIVEAGEIVKNIDDFFKDKFDKNPKVTILQNVAGNIKVVFKNRIKK